MSKITILFENVEVTAQAMRILKPMIKVSRNCNALTFDEMDEELVKWLIETDYVIAGVSSRI